ncbi:MAG: phosphate/phosphite/phosphonate ABC transporter substrate-binding protein [Alphaproteobacteria bacterium]|nr:phosphate/phosphite/phosphonate ABC transporter substrate-binding protein [Alphaproteobacteria bacterium]
MRRWVALALLCMASSPLAAAEQLEPIRLGIVPYLSPRAMLEVYNPLRLWLQNRLERPVAVMTEPNYRAFIQATAHGDYSVLLTGSHMGRMAQRENGYRPILRTSLDLVAVFVAAADDPETELDKLRGRNVILPDPLAQVSILARLFLRSRGLVPGQDVSVISAKTHNSAVLSVVNHDAVAAAVSSWAFQQMPADLARRVRVIGSSENLTGPVPGRAPALMYLTSPALSETFSQRIQQEIIAFINDSEEGRRSMGTTDREGVRAISEEELGKLDAFLPELHLVLDGM